MHNAPSVSYPLGRCAFQRNCFVALLVGTLGVLATWAYQQPLHMAMALSAWCVLWASVWGWKSLHTTGTLSWNGQVWCLHGRSDASDDELGVVHVVLDRQQALLLRWQPSYRARYVSTVWLWLEAGQSPVHWQDLRRAVYQRSELL